MAKFEIHIRARPVLAIFILRWASVASLASQVYRQKIHCKKVYFVIGNHDLGIKKIVDQFVWVKEIAEINVRNQSIVLCHYAMRAWHPSGRGAWQRYGHSHGKLPSGEGNRSMDVGVDTNTFRPYSFDQSE